jgi:hypothetical protein
MTPEDNFRLTHYPQPRAKGSPSVLSPSALPQLRRWFGRKFFRLSRFAQSPQLGSFRLVRRQAFRLFGKDIALALFFGLRLRERFVRLLLAGHLGSWFHVAHFLNLSLTPGPSPFSSTKIRLSKIASN